MRKSIIVVFAIFCIIVCSVGYAQLSDSLTISGTASAEPLGYDVYIDDVTPSSSAGVNVLSYSSTVLMMRVVDYGIATFTVTVINQSDKTYVFERVIDGAELSIDGVYDGDDITYSLSGLVSLQELAPSAHHTFDISISVPNGVTADSYILKINYMIKSDTGILPGEPDPEPDPDPDPEPDPDPDPEPDPDDPSIDDVVNENFAGLVDALLSDSEDCLNDPGSNVIFNAVQGTLTNKKRGDDAPILHCLVNSISGGTMTGITEDVNQGLTENLHFVFEADPTDTNRLYLYMYYEDQCTDENVGNRILVYKQVVSRNSEGLWYEDGTYLGSAVVGYYFGGGNGNNDVLTVDVYSWVFGELQAA